MIRPTSKIALKSSCLEACKGDLNEAQKLYEYYMKDLKDIPDFDYTPKSTMEEARETIGNAVSWAVDNKESLMTIFQAFRGGGAPSAHIPANVPPIPTPIK